MRRRPLQQFAGTFAHTIAIDDDEIDVSVTYTAHAGEPRTWDYPGSPPSVEIESVKSADGTDWLDRLDLQRLEELAMEDAAERTAETD